MSGEAPNKSNQGLRSVGSGGLNLFSADDEWDVWQVIDVAWDPARAKICRVSSVDKDARYLKDSSICFRKAWLTLKSSSMISLPSMTFVRKERLSPLTSCLPSP